MRYPDTPRARGMYLLGLILGPRDAPILPLVCSRGQGDTLVLLPQPTIASLKASMVLARPLGEGSPPALGGLHTVSGL